MAKAWTLGIKQKRMLRSQKIVLILFSLLGAAVVALAWHYGQNQRRYAETLASSNATGTGDSLAREVRNLTQSLDLVAEAMRHIMATEDLTFDLLIARLGPFLTTSADRIQETGGLVVADADGEVRFATIPLRGRISVADRPYFQLARAQPNQHVFLSAPIVNRLTGGRVFPLIWPMRDKQGDFAGVLIANISANYLERLANSGIGGPGTSLIAVLYDDGTVIAINAPYKIPQANTNEWQTEPVLAQALAQRPTHTAELYGHYRVDGAVAGIEGQWQFHNWAHASLPFGLVVGTRLDSLNQQALQTLLPVGLGATILLLILTLSAALLYRLLAVQQKAVHAAQAADQAKSDFLAMISHEIRTPMTAVLGVNRLLARTSLDNRQKDYVKALDVAGETMLALLNDLLDLSKLDAQKLKLSEADFCPDQLAEELVSLYSAQARDKGLALNWASPNPPLPVLRGDARRLRQIIGNLLGNAVKFTQSGSITLAMDVIPTQSAMLHLRVEVRDTGIGLSAEEITRLFKPFSQAGGIGGQRLGGTGLGLAVCKKLISLMGGQIGVNSTPGVGSQFWLEVPLPRGDAALATLEAVALDDSKALERCRILVAEDIALNRRLLTDGLSAMGAVVTEAADGLEALHLLEPGQFDIVLMDMHMPNMDGLQALGQIRRLPPPKRDLPVIILTANTLGDEQRRYRSHGADSVLGKPIEWPVLLKTIQSLWKPPIISVALPAAPLSPEQALRAEALEEAAKMLAALRAAPDAQQRRMQAHALRGMAGNFALTALAAAAAAIEQNPDAPDMPERLNAVAKALADAL